MDPGAAGGPAGSAPNPAVAPEVLLARAYLSRVAEPPAPALARFVAGLGPVEAAARVARGAVPDAVARETSARRTVDRARADLDAAAACGVRLLTPEHEQWPHWPFAAFAVAGKDELAPPLALWVRGPGALADLCEQSIAVVGARAATDYGMHMAGELARGAGDHGFTVVSGAAIGIDGAAHRGALAVEGPTVAALACGPDRAYPMAHEVLLERIAERGLVVSEYPPGSVPGRHRFLVRNRLIAGMAGGTVVVEAGLRSGAQRTASDARALGRPLMAVPGAVTNGLSAGCHRLIREGAQLVTRIEEVLESAGRIGFHLAEDPVAGPARPTDGLSAAAAAVHDALPARAARETGWISREAAVPIGAVRAAMVDLERRGLVEHRDGRWRRRPVPADEGCGGA
ncbi:MAG: DNA-processing protein DprA [Pseudonocardia sp.]|jgi:DNA processing protein|nr:DNA-processing protein DprA [Pseudonocardia sp.]